MKTLAILLSLSLAACATDEAPMGSGLPPLGKPELQAQSQTPDIDESFSLGDATQAPQKEFDDGRLEWVETIGRVMYLHRFDETLGVDEVSILDENGVVHALRGQVTEIDHAGIK